MGVLASLIDKSISGSFSSDVYGIGKYVFLYCSNLTSVSFPNAMFIDAEAFASCSNLTSVSLPNATNIGNYAFSGCSDLETITVGTSQSGVCKLGANAFKNCSKLTNIYVPASLVDSYKSATNWSDYAGIIKAAP